MLSCMFLTTWLTLFDGTCGIKFDKKFFGVAVDTSIESDEDISEGHTLESIKIMLRLVSTKFSEVLITPTLKMDGSLK